MFQVSKIDLTTFLAQLESRVKSQESNLKIQVIEGNHKGKICFWISGHFFSEFLKYFCGSDIFSSGYPIK